ncbi:hypothetical protein MRX96_052365 [Rhipicephalus microplus]
MRAVQTFASGSRCARASLSCAKITQITRVARPGATAKPPRCLLHHGAACFLLAKSHVTTLQVTSGQRRVRRKSRGQATLRVVTGAGDGRFLPPLSHILLAPAGAAGGGKQL